MTIRQLAAAAVVPVALLFVVGMRATPVAAPDVSAMLHHRIKHVFIIYQENRSFDNEFGTFPGADGVWSADARTHGFAQTEPVTGHTVTPFKITDPDVFYESNERAVQIQAFNGSRMNQFVRAQEEHEQSHHPTNKQLISVGEESMYHIDCDTIPLLWAYAKRFTLFDNFHQALRGPSTPSNIEIIAAQNGLTQLARHPSQQAPAVDKPGLPVFTDLDPAFGPYNSADHSAVHQIDLTYANLLLTMERGQTKRVTNDTDDIRLDEPVIARLGAAAIPWRWYQEGFTSPGHVGFIAHHAAPQYFGYVVNNDVMHSQMRDLSTFAADIQAGRLGERGLYYLKGGSQNTLGLHPANKDPFVQSHFNGDDDHPGYADAQISEAHVASLVNLIANSKYWSDSVIVITWDDAGGFWDHMVPKNFEKCPDAHPCGDGERVPAIVISPFAKTGAVVKEYYDQDSVIKLVETVFGLPALATLPDEAPYMPYGPRDANPAISNLAAAFDGGRLSGATDPLPRSLALFEDATVRSIPSPLNCASIGVRPVPPPPGVSDSPPPGFNPRPFATQAPPH